MELIKLLREQTAEEELKLISPQLRSPKRLAHMNLLFTFSS
jgi:hypothetical protein